MDPYTCKSKWNSQKIQKQCKNNHHNDIYSGWSGNSCSSYTNFCNEYHKNIHTKYNKEQNIYIMDEYELSLQEPQYWRCNMCTYDNIERDLYCSICESPFKPSYDETNASHYTSTTLSDYMPAQFTNNIYNDNDFDEDIQIAIILSYNYYSETDSDDSDVCTYFDNKRHIKAPTKPDLNGYKPQKGRRKKQGIQTKKQWLAYKEKEKKRAQNEAKALRKQHSKCIKACPKLLHLLKASKTEDIKEKISSSYSNKPFNMHCVLNYNVLCRFVEKRMQDEFDIVYHGTNGENNKSIMDNGLVVGGTKSVPIRCGAAYGRGVYCSPDISVARGYEAGSMFVCAVKKEKVRRYQSIWVVPDDSNILPLFLASFGEKAQVNVANHMNQIQQDSNQKIIKFIPSFTALNKKKNKERRKWNARFKNV